jgi:hypothetical protein
MATKGTVSAGAPSSAVLTSRSFEPSSQLCEIDRRGYYTASATSTSRLRSAVKTYDEAQLESQDPTGLDVCEDVVLDGELIKAREFVRATDVVLLFQLRGALAAQGGAANPRAYCPYCLSPLGLAGSREDSGGARATSLHFKHRANPSLICPQKSASSLTPDMFRAMKYLGQRESSDHRVDEDGPRRVSEHDIRRCARLGGD